MTTPVLHTEVLIVGAGAVGAILALELAHHNVRSILVERAVSPPRFTELDLLNGRSMELLRRLGVSGVIRRHGLDPDGAPNVVWSKRLGAPPVLVTHGRSVNRLRG